jgi:hypothetical protein
MTAPRLAFVSLLYCALAGAAAAQVAVPPPPPPPPVDSAPPPLPPVATDPELEPQVTIIRRENETLEEVRINGQLRFIRVTPTHGRPYYLIPDAGGNTFLRRDSLDTGLKVPLWVLFSW